MITPTVSVVVVSRGRSADLSRCLLGLAQLDYPSFEVVLVADPEGMTAARRLEVFDDFKAVPFDEANISKARNLGIKESAGDIVAFIDDDAVPEPTWLAHLVSGFSEPDVAVAGGFVIGRNGISFQWKARSVDVTGVAAPLKVDEDHTSLHRSESGRAIKTEGTNMAVRRSVIADMGGFDPAFRFYLDETDVNMRVAERGALTAIVPFAQVHHGYKASAIRRGDRVPLDLFEIGASTAVFLRKHAPNDSHTGALWSAKEEQRIRLLRHMVAGSLEPCDVGRILDSFERGVEAGQRRDLMPMERIPATAPEFKNMPARFVDGHTVISGRWIKRKSLIRKANTTVREGRRCSAFIFSPSSRPHNVRFTDQGVWMQSGGLFGRSERAKPVKFLTGKEKRLNLELKRVAMQRGIGTDEL